MTMKQELLKKLLNSAESSMKAADVLREAAIREDNQADVDIWSQEHKEWTAICNNLRTDIYRAELEDFRSNMNKSLDMLTEQPEKFAELKWHISYRGEELTIDNQALVFDAIEGLIESLVDDI